MKKSSIAVTITLAVLMVVSLLAGTSALAAGDARTATADLPAWKLAGGWEMDSDYVADGVRTIIPGADTKGSNDAWKYAAKIPNENSLYPVFSIADGQSVILELSVKLYDADGNAVSKSQNSNALDIYIINVDNDQQVGMLRVWTDSGSPTNGNHSYGVYGTGWNDYNAGYWIMGDATAESKFTIKFDRENFISSYVAGQDGMVPLAKEELITERREVLKNVNNVRFEVKGENGFTANTEVVVRSINAQSLASVDGEIVDTVAPMFRETSVMSSLNLGEAYTIPTEAYDLLSAVSYSLKIGGETIEGKTFTPNAAGNLDVTLVAKDAAGNTSEKNYTFHIVSSIAKPELNSVPTLTDQTVSVFDTLAIDGITYTDETGTASVVLKVLRGEETVATLSPRDDGTFAYFITADFESGAYTFVYEVTNTAGTTASEPQTINLRATQPDRAEFVSGLNGYMLAEYTLDGLALRTTQDWKDFSLGTFDISEGMDIKFVVNPAVKNGAVNDAACVSWLFVNADNSDYCVMYRVWIDHSGPDRATNVYISTDGGAHYTDITDTGWISRNVDEVAGQYHMAFDPEETFIGERTGGMTRVDNAYEKLLAFFEACPSMNFNVGLTMGNLSIEDGNYEMIVTELNGQSFLGRSFTWKNAYLSVKTDIPEKVLTGTALPIDAYAKDIRGAISLLLRVTAPDGQTTELAFDGSHVEYTFEQLGDYTLTVLTTGLNGNTVEKSFQVSARSTVTPIEITVNGSYKESYAQNDKLTILDAIYSENVVTKVISIKTPSGEVVTVSAGEQYTFAQPGVYVITYTAKDDAQPVANEKSISATINVPDTEKPVITVTVPDTAVVGDAIKPSIDVKDDSECDLTVTLVKPDGSTVKLDVSKNYEFTADAAGSYTLKVTAEDLYGNKETVEKTLTVTQEQPNEPSDPTEPSEKSDTPVVLIVVIVAVVVIGAVAVVLLMRKKKN